MGSTVEGTCTSAQRRPRYPDRLCGDCTKQGAAWRLSGSVIWRFASTSAEDCTQINANTAAARLEKAKPLILKPDKYTFRVTNKNVPYPLGFWLPGKSLLGRATLPSVSGGGMTTSTTLDYEIELKPGEYLYSCPLNPTPDYLLIVRD